MKSLERYVNAAYEILISGTFTVISGFIYYKRVSGVEVEKRDARQTLFRKIKRFDKKNCKIKQISLMNKRTRCRECIVKFIYRAHIFLPVFIL